MAYESDRRNSAKVERGRNHCSAQGGWCFLIRQCRYEPHHDVSVNEGPHIRRWSHKIIILQYNTYQQHVNRMPRNRLPRAMKYYSLTGRKNHGRPLKRILDTWDWNGPTSGPIPWKIYDDDDDTCHCVTVAYSIQYSNMLYRFVAYKQ